MDKFASDRLKNKEVVQLFIDWEVTAANHNRTLRIVDNKLMSYDKIIAQRTGKGFNVYNPTASPSQTTKKHINLLLRLAKECKDEIMLVTEFDTSNDQAVGVF